jgi:hypothetical protein
VISSAGTEKMMPGSEYAKTSVRPPDCVSWWPGTALPMSTHINSAPSAHTTAQSLRQNLTGWAFRYLQSISLDALDCRLVQCRLSAQ